VKLARSSQWFVQARCVECKLLFLSILVVEMLKAGRFGPKIKSAPKMILICLPKNFHKKNPIFNKMKNNIAVKFGQSVLK
jgi:hypothetical protein